MSDLTVPLDIVRRRHKATPVHELERYSTATTALTCGLSL